MRSSYCSRPIVENVSYSKPSIANKQKLSVSVMMVYLRYCSISSIDLLICLLEDFFVSSIKHQLSVLVPIDQAHLTSDEHARDTYIFAFVWHAVLSLLHCRWLKRDRPNPWGDGKVVSSEIDNHISRQ